MLMFLSDHAVNVLLIISGNSTSSFVHYYKSTLINLP
jgi:hypothetical protein